MGAVANAVRSAGLGGRDAGTEGSDLLDARSPIAAIIARNGLSGFVVESRSERVEMNILCTKLATMSTGKLASRLDLCARDDVLLSVRNLSTIANVDLTNRKAPWVWGPGRLAGQHEPTLTAGENLPILSSGIRESQVLELDPLEDKVVCRYSNGGDFSSEARGEAQRLPNRDTLVTESDRRHVLEVDRDGNVAWEFLNSPRDTRGNRQPIYRKTRYEPENLPFLRGSGVGQRLSYD